jgi:multidrug resistance efflux pump
VVEQQADVVAERDGRVTAVKAEIGDHVRRGEVLALLDDRALQAAHAEKAARIDSLRAQVKTWEAEQQATRPTCAGPMPCGQSKYSTKRIGSMCDTSSRKR